MNFQAFGATDKGKKRPHNEDSFAVDNELRLFVVADGMGGHAAGEVASSTAIEVIRKEMGSHTQLISSFEKNPSPELREKILDKMEAAIQKACSKIYNMGEKDEKRRGMGTTLSALLLVDRGVFIVHVGDSRVYLLREGQVHQLSVDHSLVNEQLRRGVLSKTEARTALYKNVITRAVGIQERVTVDTLHLDVLPGDRFLLCSDGLHGYLKPEDFELLIDRNQDVVAIPQELIGRANERGGKDNITLILVDVASDEKGVAEELRQRIEIMRNAPLFKYLSYRELVTLMNLTYIRSVADDELLIEEGVSGDELFLLVRGRVRVFKGKQEIAVLPEGSHFGEMALFDNGPRSASIRSVGPTSLLVLERKQFYDYVRKDTVAGVKLLWSLLQILTLRLRNTDAKLREAHKGSSYQEVEPEWILPED